MFIEIINTKKAKIVVGCIYKHPIYFPVRQYLGAMISDHLPQFLFAPNILSNPSFNKSNIFERD